MNEQRLLDELCCYGRWASKGQFPGVRTTPAQTKQVAKQAIDGMRELIRDLKKMKGYEWSIAVGENTLNLEIAGDARVMLGIILYTEDNDLTAMPDSVTLIVNREQVIDNVKPDLLSPVVMDDEYYFIPRPLSGQDTISLKVTASASTTLYGAIYYL